MDKLLKKLINAFAVSGREEERATVIKDFLSEKNINYVEDLMGNILVKLGKGTEKIMLTTHMDSIGLLANYIEDNGLIRTEKIGGFNAKNFAYSSVKFKNGGRARVSSGEKEELFVDLGLASREEVLRKIKEGDSIAFFSELVENNGRLVGHSLEAAIGCFIFLNLISEGYELNRETYFVFSVQHQGGGRGARSAAFEIKPDYALILQGEEALDHLEAQGNIKLGAGPVLSIMDRSLILHHEVKTLVEAAALEANIKLQYSISKGTSDGGTVHKESSGVKTGVLAFPIRYINTPSEMVMLKDVEAVTKVLKNIIIKGK
jgi:tetrahedral aminopeptidase